MKEKWSVSTGRLVASVLIAAAAVWRLPNIVALPEQAWAYWMMNALLFAAFLVMLVFALGNRDKRLARIAYPLGFVFACFAVLGKPISAQHALPSDALAAVLLPAAVAVYTVVLGAAVLALYRGMLRWLERKPGAQVTVKKESWFSRLTGNWLFVFALLLLCWVPVWLAFYPGTFRYDADTQFYTYVDECMTTHHPLLHTLLLGWLVDWGNELDSLTLGVAMYCGAQLAAMAGILAYACAWLRRRAAPLAARTVVLVLFALLPLYPLWSFSATKDVLFGGFVLLLCLQTADLWRDSAKWFRSPFRLLAFLLTAVLMMLLRNNGVYAFVLALPFAVIAAKSRRIRTALLFLVCIAGYLGCNQLLVNAVMADGGSYVEMLSIPLQQTMRAVTYGDTTGDEQAALAELFDEYDGDWTDLYVPLCADNVKWNLDEDILSDDWGGYLSLWWRVGLKNPRLYAEAFLEQNLPYFYPGSKMQYNIVLGLLPMDLYELEEQSYLPQLRPFYEAYDDTLTLFGLPVTELLADNAFMVWVTLLLLGLAVYRRKRGAVIAATFLLAVWATCLLGPIAAMRYMLGFFYTVPVLTAAAFAGKDAA